MMMRGTNLEYAAASDLLEQIKLEVDAKRADLSRRSRTSQLWVNYQKMRQTAQALIKEDRTGS